MFDTSDVVAALAALTALASVWFTYLHKRRYTKAEAWLRESAQYDLVAVADHADKYALEGVGQPGTQAVRTLYPGFDFTMGGKYEDRPLRNTENVWYAPWPEGIVESLAAYQDSGAMHPYTCRLDSKHGNLVPQPEGWACRVCAYTQQWALRSHADGSWRRDYERMLGMLARAKAATRRRNAWVSLAQRRLGLFQSSAPKPGNDERR